MCTLLRITLYCRLEHLPLFAFQYGLVRPVEVTPVVSPYSSASYAVDALQSAVIVESMKLKLVQCRKI